jgi:zinc protease
VIQVEFENGVRLTFHPTHEQNPGAAIFVRVGSGCLAAERDESDVAWVAGRVFVAGGLGEHTFAELQQILASGRLAFGFEMTFDACVFSGSAAPDGFQRLCETICAFLADPGWREDAFDEFMGNVPRLYESMESGFSGPLSRFHAQLHPGDSRFALPDRELVESFLLDTVKEFLAPQLEEGPIELSIVGGMDPNALIAICARTFGMLPARGEAPDLSGRLESSPVASGVKFKAEIETDEKKAHVAIAWPVGDGIDVRRRAELQFLAAALDNRVRVEIREKKGAAYAPRVTHDLSELFPGVGLIRIDVECDPAQAPKVLEACLALGDRLAKDGITDAEFEQVRAIARTQVEQWLRSDGFWLAALSDAWSRPQSLEELRRGMASVEDVERAAIQELARAHFVRAKASTAVITPKKAAKSK